MFQYLQSTILSSCCGSKIPFYQWLYREKRTNNKVGDKSGKCAMGMGQIIVQLANDKLKEMTES